MWVNEDLPPLLKKITYTPLKKNRYSDTGFFYIFFLNLNEQCEYIVISECVGGWKLEYTYKSN